MGFRISWKGYAVSSFCVVNLPLELFKFLSKKMIGSAKLPEERLSLEREIPEWKVIVLSEVFYEVFFRSLFFFSHFPPMSI